jgi:phospholipase/lecithinase/hemolysin
MTGLSKRRGFLAAAGASALAAGLGLTACGSGTIESALTPKRLIGFGDGFSDLGQSGSRFTVNDGSSNVWSQQLAANYGMTMASVAGGGFGYAQGNARVNTTPDAAGKASTQTIKQQIDAFLAASSFAVADLVLINGGYSDIVAETARVVAGTQTGAQMLVNVGQAGVALGNQIQRMVTAGAKYIVVAGVYNLSKSPWAAAIGQGALLDAASAKFNEQLLITIVNLGANVLYVDAAYYFNLVTAAPTGYGLTDAGTVVCTSVDSGAGIGTGAGKVSSALCNASTIVTGLSYNSYAFADGIYLTPAANVLFGNYAFTRLRTRW